MPSFPIWNLIHIITFKNLIKDVSQNLISIAYWWDLKLLERNIKNTILQKNYFKTFFGSVQFSSVTQSCPTLCDPTNCSTPGLPVHHQLPEFTQTHIHRVSDVIHPSHLLLPPFPLALNHSPDQGLFQQVGSSHQVAKVLELQLQHQSFQWIFRTDFL